MFLIHTKVVKCLVKTEENINKQNPNTVSFCNSFSKMSPNFKKIEAKLQQLELAKKCCIKKIQQVVSAVMPFKCKEVTVRVIIYKYKYKANYLEYD